MPRKKDAPASPVSSRARVGKKKRSVAKAPPAARVAEIRRLMSEGRYEGAATRLQLAEKYGVGEAAIMRDAAEAHHQLAADPEEVARQKASLAAFCGRMREQAATNRNEVTGLADVSSALKAAELQAKFMGIDIEPAKKVELTGAGGGPVSVTLDEVDTALQAAEQNAAPNAGPSGGNAPA